MRLLFLIFFNIIHLLTYSQSDRIRFKYLTSDNGLSSSCANSIVQDDQGFIWIGTDEGLNKFDGYNFEIFKNQPKDTTSLYSNYILTLYNDDDGVLWIGTSRGVNTYDRNTNSIIRKKEFPVGSVSSIIKDKDGNVIIGAQNLFVLYKDTQKVIEFFPDKNNKHSISYGNVSVIFIDSKNRIWVGTPLGLNLFDIKKGEFKRFFAQPNNKNSLNSNDIRSITEDKNNVIWVATGEGLCELHISGNNPDSIIFKSHKNNPSDPSSISPGAINELFCDDQNNLWIGSRNEGLDILKINNRYSQPNSFIHYTYEEYSSGSINNNTINCIFKDSFGNIWIGTYAGGINLYCKDTKKFGLYKHYPQTLKSINNNQVNVFLEEEDYIWIGTEGGLNRYNKKARTYKYYTFDKNNPSSIGANAVWAIVKDKKGQLWVGTWGGGLNLFDYESERFVRYIKDPSDKYSINSNNVFSIFPDQNNNLWIGTMGGGLNFFDTKEKQFINYTVANSDITTNYVEEIIEISDNQLLLANVDGVSVFDKKSKTFVPQKKVIKPEFDMSTIRVSTLFVDRKKNLWFGTEAGLFVINHIRKKFNHYTTAEGLSNNSIKSILEDDKGNLWLGTNGGISKLMDATTIPDNPEFYNYSHQDGLQGNEFNRRSCLKSNSGYMYFGGPNGFNTFLPDSITNNPNKSKAIITDFLLFNKPVKIGSTISQLDINISEKKEIVLNFKQNGFGFKFVAINYLSPEKQKYAYMLKGFESEWNYVGNQKEANYTNMDPGVYEFMVKVSDSDGNVYSDPTVLKITIKPPLWFTIWAFILYGIVLILLLFFYWHYTIIKINTKNHLEIEHLKYQKQEEINQAKLYFFTNVSHELRTPLTLIHAPVEDMLNDSKISKKTRDQLVFVHQNLKRLLNLINQLLDFRKIDSGSENLYVSYNNITNLINSIICAFQYQNELKKIVFSFKNKEEPIYSWFDYEKMTTILYNLISNAVKYSKEFGQVDIEINLIRKPLISKTRNVRKFFSRDKIQETDFIEIIISDKGIGIPKFQLDKIFEPYYRAFENQPVNIKGTGIGLNITKQYVELHHGNIWVKSNVGQGSCFVFQIPSGNKHLKDDQISKENKVYTGGEIEEFIKQDYISDAENLNIDFIPGIPDNNDKPVILIVEDNKDLVSYLDMNLNQDYLVVKAPTGKHGLELANKYNPDIIVSDIMMPELDGISMTRQLKTNIGTSHIPIIILTAKTRDENMIEGIENGADAYISKPFKIDLLKAYIITILDSRKKLKEKYSQLLKLEPTDITVNKTDEKFLKKLLQIIEENIPNPDYHVMKLSEDMHMSYRVLARKVKALTNQPVNEFIRSMKLKRAALILEKDNLPIIEVSTMTGFSDPAYFSRCFRNQYGVSPSQYLSNDKEDTTNPTDQSSNNESQTIPNNPILS